MKTFRVFGHDVPYKDKPCALYGTTHGKFNPHTNIYVRVTEQCAMRCPFCAFAKPTGQHVRFETYKFLYGLQKIAKACEVRKISFTGGEPLILGGDLFRLIKEVKEIVPDAFVVVSTAAYNQLATMDAEYVKDVDSFAVSVHSDVPTENAELFGNDMRPSNVENRNPRVLEGVTFKDKIHITCNLVKGYVDGAKRMDHFIRHFAAMGFWDFGFVGLMPVNDYAKEHFVDFNSTHFEELPSVRETMAWNQEDACFCKNYLHQDQHGNISKVYARWAKKPAECVTNLVFDMDKYRIGFSGPKIL